MYKKNIKTSWKFAFMAFLRFLSLGIVFITLGSLLITAEVETKVKPKLVVAFDQSSSMLLNANMNKLQSVFSDLNDSKLSENYSIKNIGFGKYVSVIDSLKFDKPRTNYKNLEKKLDLLMSENDKVILISDGNINSGTSSVFSKKKKYNLNIIGVGDTTINTSISIAKINYNKKVIIGNSFPVELFIETSNYSGDIKLEVSEKSKVVYSDKFSILPNSERHQKHRHSILMKSSREGTHVYKIRLLSGIENNLTTEKIIAVDFVKNRGLVLIEYKHLNPDISLFKRKLVSRNYKVVVIKNAV
ncbi:MAG: hypothetical protein KAG37_00915, partial [Flavobacteriales bacterium]|nr:hypothetical protein [Flavobacteriales bacterium]